MTAPNGPIVFNNSTGSDTQASGLGPATAVFGTTGSCTSGSAVVTGIDTTGVAAGDLFWGATSSGRQSGIIASVDSGTQVTLDYNLTATHSGDLTWAIGGKRATLDSASSRALIYYEGYPQVGLGGSYFEVQYTGTNYTLTSAFQTSTMDLRGTGASKPVIEQTINTVHFYCDSGSVTFNFRYLKFINTNATKTSACMQGHDGTNQLFKDCVFGSDVTSERIFTLWARAGSEHRGLVMVGCEIVNTVGNGLVGGNFNYTYDFTRCTFRNCGSGAIAFGDSGPAGLTVIDCIFRDITGVAITGSTVASARISNCRFYNISSHATSVGSGPVWLAEFNVFDEIGGYCFNGPVTHSYHNAYHNVTSGFRNGASPDATDMALTADPFWDAENGDFGINNAPGGGAVLRGTTISI